MAQRNVKDILSSTKRRKKRRKLLLLRIYFFGGLFLLIVIFFIFDLHLDKFRLKNIEVSGVSEEQKQKIVNFTQGVMAQDKFSLIPKDSYFFFDRSVVQNALSDNFKDLENIKVSSRFSNVLTISASERLAGFVYCFNICYLADSKGYIYSVATSTPDNILTYADYSISSSTEPINPVSTHVLDASTLKSVSDLVSRLASKNIIIKVINIESRDHLNLKVVGNGFIKINPRKSFDDAYQNILTVLTKATSTYEYIDVRFDKKMFYK